MIINGGALAAPSVDGHADELHPGVLNGALNEIWGRG